MSIGDSVVQSYFATVVNTPVEGNEAPEFASDTYTFTVYENVTNAQEIGMLTVSDDDGEYISHYINN